MAGQVPSPTLDQLVEARDRLLRRIDAIDNGAPATGDSRKAAERSLERVEHIIRTAYPDHIAYLDGAR